MTFEEAVRSHGKKDVLMHGLAKVEHASLGVETDHGMLAFEPFVWPLKIQVEKEVMGTDGIREDGSEADGITDGKLKVEHGLVHFGEDFLLTPFELELVIDDDIVAVGEGVDDGDIFVFIAPLKIGEL